MCEVATRALKTTWHKKWQVSRRLRPEAWGGLVHHQKVHNRYPGVLDARRLTANPAGGIVQDRLAGSSACNVAAGTSICEVTRMVSWAVSPSAGARSRCASTATHTPRSPSLNVQCGAGSGGEGGAATARLPMRPIPATNTVASTTARPRPP